MKLYTGVSLLLISLTVVSCTKKKEKWGYDPKNGPQKWSELNRSFHQCKDGDLQSPIELTAISRDDHSKATPSYSATHVDLINNGHTIVAQAKNKGTLRVNEKIYNLEQFHFHHPSEHTVNRKHYEMEIHLVHRSADNQFAVLGILVNEGEGADPKAFSEIFDHLPEHKDGHFVANDRFSPSLLLPVSLKHFHYRGSLTTPPCTENVDWVVIKEPIKIPRRQLDKFVSLFPHNNRPVQRLGEASRRCIYPLGHKI